jgi:O-antigen/teichoic acid export membrane protein
MDKTIDVQPPLVGKGRTYKAVVAALFTYAQFAVALGAAFFIVPRILRTVGARQYGLWLSSGELLGYLVLLDFGVFATLPWLIARADGLKSHADIKRHIAQGLTVAMFLSMLIVLIVFGYWSHIPATLHLTIADWHALAGPLCVLVLLLAISLPLNIFTSVLGGLQDAGFLGTLNLAKALLGPAVTIGFLLAGYRLYALAIGTAVLAPVGGIVNFFRLRKLAPELLHDWPLPTVDGALRLFRESIGAWLSGTGVQMMERSSALVLALLGAPAIIPVLVCSSRVGQILTQMAWVLPDSALVGLAQLSGENNATRQRQVAFSIIRLNLVAAGFGACLVLAINPAFVRIWVGEHLFGGLLLNMLLAVEVISGSLVHGLCTVLAVQGHRLSIGLATVLQGAIYITLALILGRRYSLTGLLAADLIAPALSTLPVCLWLLRFPLGFDLRRLGLDLAYLLFLRAGPCLLFAGAYGYWRERNAWLPELALAGIVTSLVYLRVMASQLATFPLPGQARVWLQRFRLM